MPKKLFFSGYASIPSQTVCYPAKMAHGHIITYDRNIITNELIDKAGVKVSPIPGGELSRGRGGPRCMSMPMLRDEIK